MNMKGNFSAHGDIEQKLMEHIEKDEKRKYRKLTIPEYA